VDIALCNLHIHETHQKASAVFGVSELDLVFAVGATCFAEQVGRTYKSSVHNWTATVRYQTVVMS
jgi:hypothetical protein